MKTLELKDVQALNNYKHHLLDENKAKDISSVVSNLVGLHSARLITPYATLIPRVKNFDPSDLTNELFVNNNLIKLRCMRKTLHTVSLDLAPIVHQSTKKIRLSICKGIYKKLDISEYKISKVKEIILESIQYIDLSSKEIENYVLKNSNTSLLVTRAILKELWENGIICYNNKSDYWGKESRAYSLTSRKYPSLILTKITISEAQKSLVMMHIKCYGPVTEKDISWWSGLSISTIKNCIQSLNKSITKVTVKNLKGVFFIHSSDLENIRNIVFPNKITLLAYEDPSLKGYYESRERYIVPKFYKNLFNPIGEARASILKNGTIVGIWSWDKKRSDITTSLFMPLNTKDKSSIKILVEKTRASLAPRTN